MLQLTTAASRDVVFTSCMQGGGEYNRHSAPQLSNVGHCIDNGFVRQAVQSINSSDPSLGSSQCPVHLADLGCAQGNSSIPLVNATIDELLRLPLPISGPPLNVQVWHEDLPSNDFDTLLRTLQTHPNSYTQRKEVVATPHTVPRSFFEPCVADGLLTFAFASSAFHWLSGLPTLLQHSTSAHSTRNSEEEKKAWREWARKDWLSLLRCRAVELRPGGVFLLNNPGRSSDDDLHPPSILLGDVLRDVLQRAPVSQHWTGKDAAQFTVPFYRRSVEEHCDKETLAAVGLTLCFAELRPVPSPLWANFVASDGDVEAFLDSFVGHIRAAGYASYRSALQVVAPSLSSAELDAACTDFYQAVRTYVGQRIAEDDMPKFSSQSVVRQLANDHQTMFMAVRKK